MKVDRVLLLSLAALALPAAVHAEMPQSARQQAAKPKATKPRAAKQEAARPQSAVRQTQQPAAAAGPAPATGPRVHVSKSRDVTDCTARTQGGKRTVVGQGLGALVGSKVGGANAVMVGSAAAGAVGESLDKKERCGPSAQIESNAAPADAPKKKKKISLGRILGQ